MISLGAVAVPPDSEGSLFMGDTFYVEIRPVSERVDPRALAVCGLDIEHLKAHGLSRHDALLALSRFVKEQTRKGTSPVFVGHNAPFDWSFVAYSYGAESLSNPFGYKALDTKALAAGALRLHWQDTSKEKLHEHLSLPAEDMSLKHRADYDALYQARILLALLGCMGWQIRTSAG